MKSLSGLNVKAFLISTNFLVPLMLVFMFFVMVTSSTKDSAIRDEMPHIVSGYSYIKTGDYRLNPEHPPLIKDLGGLSLLFLNPQPKLPQDHFQRPLNDQWSEGNAFLYETGNNPDLMLFWGRLPIILLSLFGGYFVFKWAKELYGKRAGLFALFLYVFDANIVAHSRFITTDLGIAVTIFINLYFLWKFITEPSKKRLLWVAITLAIALLTKFSAPILVITYALVGIFLSFFPGRFEKGALIFTRFFNAGFFRRFLGYFISFFTAGLIALIMVWIVYFIQTINMPPDIFKKSVEVGLGNDSPAKNILLSMSDNAFLRPIGHHILGFSMVAQHAVGGHTSYLLGELSTGKWYYYIVVFLIKTSIPALVFIFSALVFWKPKKDKDNKAKLVLLIPILVISGFALTTKINLGIRYLLPIFPLFYVFVSFLAERFSLKDILETVRGRIRFAGVFGIILITLTTWHAISSLKVYPSYLGYFNEAIGGPKNGMRYVTDSNIDWGQDLRRLSDYTNKHDIKKIHLDYFGGGDPQYYLGNKFIPWTATKKPESGWYAISVTYFQQANVYGDYQWLKNIKPYTTIGYSILIFKYQI